MSNQLYVTFSKFFHFIFSSQTVPCKDLLLWTNHRTPHHTSTQSFVKPTATNAANWLLKMGKERPKHAELQKSSEKITKSDI
jgi:hypothetical protein